MYYDGYNLIDGTKQITKLAKVWADLPPLKPQANILTPSEGLPGIQLTKDDSLDIYNQLLTFEPIATAGIAELRSKHAAFDALLPESVKVLGVPKEVIKRGLADLQSTFQEFKRATIPCTHVSQLVIHTCTARYSPPFVCGSRTIEPG
jgi:hypothetical protein